MEDHNKIKTLDELECETDITYRDIRLMIPKYKVLVEACEGYCKAQSHMIKATESVEEAVEQLGHCGHQDLNVGTLNIANIFDMWKKNLIEVSNQFKVLTNTITNELAQLPKEFEKSRENSRQEKNRAYEEFKKATKKAESVRKNKKLRNKNPMALKESIDFQTEKETVCKNITTSSFREALYILRGTYGQLFEYFKQTFKIKYQSDFKSQQLYKAQAKEMNSLISLTKVLPQKCNALFSMNENNLIDASNFENEAKEILLQIGLKDNQLTDFETIADAIKAVKVAIENGYFNVSFIVQLKESLPEKVIESEESEETTSPIPTLTASTPSSNVNTKPLTASSIPAKSSVPALKKFKCINSDQKKPIP
ncbi:Uncharacterized protein QTN25_004750 [Entamoeba marina]